MSKYHRAIGLAVCGTLLLQASTALADATVSYHGYLYGEDFTPIHGGFVVAGTFAPGFNPAFYFYIYGDAFGNVAPGHYSAAVAAGSFRPIGPPVSTSASGFFNGSGTTTAAVGTQMFLFAFPDQPDLGGHLGVLATGSGQSFRVPDNMGMTTIDAATANQFYWGRPVNDGIGVRTLPIPEPTVLALLTVFAPIGPSLGPRLRRSLV